MQKQIHDINERNEIIFSKVEKAKGVLKNFLIEPFVAHKQVKKSSGLLRTLYKRIIEIN